MTRTKWVDAAKAALPNLQSLIAQYHPASDRTFRHAPAISAPAAERFAETVRAEIRAADAATARPVDRFATAVGAGNVAEISTLLNEAWFGVPESHDCWSVTGFADCVRLLEDPPEDDEETFEAPSLADA